MFSVGDRCAASLMEEGLSNLRLASTPQRRQEIGPRPADVPERRRAPGQVPRVSISPRRADEVITMMGSAVRLLERAENRSGSHSGNTG